MAEHILTSTDALRAGFAALLRDDTATRDRMVERARILMAHERYDEAVQRVMETDFYVTAQGAAIPAAILKQVGEQG